MSHDDSKEYGLIVPSKNKKKTAPQLNQEFSTAFKDSDSDDSDKGPTNWKQKSLQKSKDIPQKRQTRIIAEKALAQDPTVFQYDEVYDELEKKHQDKKAGKSSQDKKPKYIDKLMKASDERKKEQERRLERDIQKEREAEAGEFADKEAFVTSAYKTKLEEREKEEREERRKDAEEAMLDVTKQGDLGGFYRHLFHQRTGDQPAEKIKEEDQVKKEPKKEKKSDSSDDEPKRKRSVSRSSGSSDGSPKSSKKRQYRGRDESVSTDGELPSDGEGKKKSGVKPRYEDSDFSSDEESRRKKRQQQESSTESEEEKEGMGKSEKGVEKNGEVKEKKEVKETKPKVDVWKKRTVGEALVAAQERYYQRKAAREQ